MGADPGSAFVLALGVAEDGSRPLEAVIERVVRDGDDQRVSVNPMERWQLSWSTPRGDDS